MDIVIQLHNVKQQYPQKRFQDVKKVTIDGKGVITVKDQQGVKFEAAPRMWCYWIRCDYPEDE